MHIRSTSWYVVCSTMTVFDSLGLVIVGGQEVKNGLFVSEES